MAQGSLQLQDLFARTMIEPGDAVFVEEPSYDRALRIFERAGARRVGFAMEDDGVDVGSVAASLEQGERPVLFYLIPDFQNPSGTLLSQEKRQSLVELARTYDFWIIEDVPYRRLRYQGEEVPSLFDLAPERVLQMSSYSKLISPGLRVGFVIAPEALVDRLAKAAEDTYINPSYLNQAIVAEFIQRGWLEPQIEELKGLYEPRLYTTLGAFEEYMDGAATWREPEGGFFVGVTLNGAVDTDELLREAEKANLALTDGRTFFVDGANGKNFIRFPYCALTPEQIREGVRRLSRVVSAVV